MSSKSDRIGLSSSSQIEEIHFGQLGATKGIEVKTLSTKSKLGITAFVIGGIAGIVMVGLGAAGLFGHVGSIEFIASIAGGGIVTLISVGGIVWLVITRSKDRIRSDNISVRDDSDSKINRTEPDNQLLGNSNQYFSDLATRIRECPPRYEPEQMSYEDFGVVGAIPTRDYASIFIHAHEVLPHVYLGDYRGFLSVDPNFVQQYPMADELEAIFDGHPTKNQKKWAEENLDFHGCMNKNIKVVVSVTQFKSSAQDKEWSTFQPNLERLNVHRIQIPVDDVDGAWEIIEPQLDEIFQQIDLAIQGRGNLLVHCVKGASRSAAVIYAYLMNRCDVTLDEAHNYIKSIRHQVELKPSMRKSLELYKEKL